MKSSEVISYPDTPIDPATVDDVTLAKALDALVQCNRPREADDLLRQVALARNHPNAAILLLDRLGGNG